MQTVKNSLSLLGGVLIAALFLAALAPRAVHAVVASFVNVVNTPANPIPVFSTDKPALQPFGQLFFADGPPSFSFNVPVGKTLVIEELGVDCLVLSGPAYKTNFTLTVTNSTIATSFAFAPQQSAGSTVLAQPVHIYADSGSTVQIGNQGDLAGTTQLECNTSVAGQYVSAP